MPEIHNMSQHGFQRPAVVSADIAAFGFDITQLRLQFCTLDPVHLPTFAGSTWRGALGQALRRVACVYTETMDCCACTLRGVCWYTRLYETAIDPRCAMLKGYTDAPHPLILDIQPLGGELAAGAEPSLELLLIGQAKEAVPILVQAARRLAAYGLGHGRGRLELTHWELADLTATENSAGNPWFPPTMCSPVQITLDTPLRLRVDNRVLDSAALNPHAFCTTLLRRISLLACSHSDTELAIDFKSLAEATARLSITSKHLEWLHWARYSSRQQRHIAMDGLVGSLVLNLSAAPEWWPYLWLGQWLHVGKGISMGMGRYRLHSP